MGDRDNPHTASADGTADEAGDASFEAADAPDTLVCDGGQPLWGRRLTRRARLWRGAVGVSVVLLVAYLLVGGPAMAFAAITAFWASHAPVTRRPSSQRLREHPTIARYYHPAPTTRRTCA